MAAPNHHQRAWTALVASNVFNWLSKYLVHNWDYDTVLLDVRGSGNDFFTHSFCSKDIKNPRENMKVESGYKVQIKQSTSYLGLGRSLVGHMLDPSVLSVSEGVLETSSLQLDNWLPVSLLHSQYPSNNMYSIKFYLFASG